MLNGKILTRVLSVCFLAAIVVAPRTAMADIIDGQCYSTLEYEIYCSNDKGCEESVRVPTCIPGTVGSVCQTGGGLCCGSPYDTKSADGECESGNARHAQNRSAYPTKTRPSQNQDSNLRLAQDLPRRVIFAPDRCGRSYGAIEPEFFDKRGM